MPLSASVGVPSLAARSMLLDTDVLIDLEHELPAAEAWFAALSEMPSVPGYAALEMLFGARDQRELRGIEKLLRPLPVLWPPDTERPSILTDYPRLNLSHGLGLLDSLIAATAVGHGLTLVTFNTKHYRVVPGLVTAQPYPH